MVALHTIGSIMKSPVVSEYQSEPCRQRAKKLLIKGGPKKAVGANDI